MSDTPAILSVLIFAEGQTASTAAQDVGLRSLAERIGAAGLSAEFQDFDAPPPEADRDTPLVYLSIGTEDQRFRGLWQLPFEVRRRWLHYSAPEKVSIEALVYCWLSATDPMVKPPEPRPEALSDQPLVSVFTAAYRTGERLHRTFRSLLAQTYARWEWVIEDDSGDGGETFRAWVQTLDDARVVKVPPQERSGRIGTVKRRAADRCRGDILVELDHDDELTPFALERIVAALCRNPDCGFVFGEASEVYEETLASHWYGWDAGFGFLAYWRQYDHQINRLVDVPRTASTNWRTVRHLVGLPNHPRAWARWAYEAAGGHRYGLFVADDFDLLLRTLLVTRPLRVPDQLYRQYRRPDGGNQTFVRNRAIQFLCGCLEHVYRERIEDQMRRWSMPVLDGEYRRIWHCDPSDPRWVMAERRDTEDSRRETFLYVFPPSGHQSLEMDLVRRLKGARAEGWNHLEIVVVGRVPEPLLTAEAPTAPPGRLRWWTTDPDWKREDTIHYGRLLCTSTQVTVLIPPASDVAWGSGQGEDLTLRYVDAFAPADPVDRHRNRLALLRHLKAKFGYRRYLEIGTDQDEVFSRMNGFELKVGVDPNAGGTHRMTSDAYFDWNRAQPPEARHRFDLILVDGLHEWSQVLRDVDNSLELLEPGGTIVLHDCMPFEERHQTVPRPMPIGFWTGNHWKAVFLLRQRPDIDIAVGRFDWGVGVLRKRPNARTFVPPKGDPALWSWGDYLGHRDEGLNLIGWAGLLEWLVTSPATPAPEPDGETDLKLRELRKRRFMVAIHCPSGVVSEPTCHALVRLFTHAERSGFHFTLGTAAGDDASQATAAIAQSFLASACSHLLILDSSMDFTVEDIFNLYAMDRDMAFIPIDAGTGITADRFIAEDESRIGVLLMRRRAVTAVAAHIGTNSASPALALSRLWHQAGQDARLGMLAAAQARVTGPQPTVLDV